MRTRIRNAIGDIVQNTELKRIQKDTELDQLSFIGACFLPSDLHVNDAVKAETANGLLESL